MIIIIYIFRVLTLAFLRYLSVFVIGKVFKVHFIKQLDVEAIVFIRSLPYFLIEEHAIDVLGVPWIFHFHFQRWLQPSLIVDSLPINIREERMTLDGVHAA